MCGRMCSVLLVLLSSLSAVQVCPLSYNLFPLSFNYLSGTKSVNGSSANGHCSHAHTEYLPRCDAPKSSVLFDCNIPTLTGLDGDMWASQLLTLRKTIPSREEIILDFSDTPDCVTGVELVMFNCPEWGISAQSIRLHTAQSIMDDRSVVETFTVPATTTSCDSLVRICISKNITQPVIGLEFIPPPGSNWTHLAEVILHSSNSTCPLDTNITTSPVPDTIATTSVMSAYFTNSDVETTSVQPSSSSTTITNLSASIGCVVLLIVCILAAMLILWRCYYVKYHKYNTSNCPAVGEGRVNTQSHPPPVTLFEETGQVYYSTVQPQESNDTYSHIHHDIITGRGVSKKSREDTATEDVEMGGYSMVSYGDKSQEQNARGPQNEEKSCILTEHNRKKGNQKIIGDNIPLSMLRDTTHPNTTETDTPVDQLYAQVDKKKMKMKKKVEDTTYPARVVGTLMNQMYAQVEDKKEKGDENTTHPEAETPVDLLYTQVDKKMKKKKKDEDTTYPAHEADTIVNQVYAQVEKKEKEDENIAHPEADTPIHLLYAKVDKKKSKGKDMCEDSHQESVAVYSVVNQPHPPQ